MTKEQVKITMKNGGQFIISPNTDKKVITTSKKLNMVSIPGALTPSEAVSATGWGADFVKLFPATNLGPSYIKAISAPLSNIKFLAVGGIDENNMNDYLTGLEEKQSQPELNQKVIDTLLQALSLCYLNNIDLNTIFKMEVK
jgi:2-keto-3-deoxy-6-phosphogluconate aldolase